MSPGDSFWSQLLDLLNRLFKQPTPPPTPIPLPPDTGELVSLAPRVLMIIYNPTVDSANGKKLIETLGWNNPDALAAGYIADVKECSGGLVQYKIVERVEADEFPKKQNGFQYQPQQYLAAYRAGSGLEETTVDYQAIVANFDLLTHVANDEIDEVWLFGFPGAGFYESIMAGKGAFVCNSNPLPNTDASPRRFVIMGFSTERGVGEMEEDLGHRSEATLARVFHSEKFLSWAYNRARDPKTVSSPKNLFERFLFFDQIAPGQSNIGTIHYAPNSTVDYEWNNTTPVPSCADDWYKFPDLPNPPNYKTTDARDWGSGEIRAHHRWWLKHLPKAAGLTDGMANNWWKYIADPNKVL